MTYGGERILKEVFHDTEIDAVIYGLQIVWYGESEEWFGFVAVSEGPILCCSVLKLFLIAEIFFYSNVRRIETCK